LASFAFKKAGGRQNHRTGTFHDETYLFCLSKAYIATHKYIGTIFRVWRSRRQSGSKKTCKRTRLLTPVPQLHYQPVLKPTYLFQRALVRRIFKINFREDIPLYQLSSLKGNEPIKGWFYRAQLTGPP
jgi:hypothetical protein